MVEEEEGGYGCSSRLQPGFFYIYWGLSENRRMRLQCSRFICRRLDVTDTVYIRSVVPFEASTFAVANAVL